MSDDFAELFLERFAGRPDVFALWVPPFDEDGRGFYIPSTYENPEKEWLEDHVQEVLHRIDVPEGEFGLTAAQAHLAGEVFIGVYPIWEDSTVQFFALDFDKSPEEAWAEACRQQKLFEDEAGIATYIERSRSGNGYHLWGFLEEPVNAGELRHALSQFIEDQSTYDRMFPNQDSVSETRPLGNLIALPLFGPKVDEGKGVFVTAGKKGNPKIVKNQEAYLEDVELIPATVLEELFGHSPDKYSPDMGAKAREGSAGELNGSFKMTSPKFGCEWIQWAYDNPEEVSEPAWYVLACQFAQFEDGRELFHEWSEQDPDRYDAKATDLKFDHALSMNAPQASKYIREQGFGPGCHCDKRFRDLEVYHPCDLATLSLSVLINSIPEEQRVTHVKDEFGRAVTRAEAIHKDPTIGRGHPYQVAVINEHTGKREGDLVVIGARPGQGKTTFIIDDALNLALQGTPVFLFSLEMEARQLGDKLLARVAEIDSRRILTGRMTPKDWKAVRKARDKMEALPYLPFFIDDVTGNIDEMIDQTGELMAEHGKGVVYVDYLQLIDSEGNSRREEVDNITRQLKRLAKFAQICVVAVVQLNRLADDATDDSATFDYWLKESGQIEQDAAVIMFILGDRSDEKPITPKTLVIHKERYMGAGARIELSFNKAIGAFGAPGTWQAVSSDRHADQDREEDVLTDDDLDLEAGDGSLGF